MSLKKKYILKVKTEDLNQTLIDFLHIKSNVSKSLIKKALKNGAVFEKNASSSKRVRKIKKVLLKETTYLLNIDELILNKCLDSSLEPIMIKESHHWGVWQKPVNLLSQGSEWGDHLSLIRFLEKSIGKNVFLINRLDKETNGLVLVAYNKKIAKYLSLEFSNRRVVKKYVALVKGDIRKKLDNNGIINDSLDGKISKTYYEFVKIIDGNSQLLLTPETGRFHQIRRHLDLIGFPILGDPIYGTNNKFDGGLQLKNTLLKFKLLNGDIVEVSLP